MDNAPWKASKERMSHTCTHRYKPMKDGASYRYGRPNGACTTARIHTGFINSNCANEFKGDLMQSHIWPGWLTFQRRTATRIGDC